MVTGMQAVSIAIDLDQELVHSLIFKNFMLTGHYKEYM